MGLFDRLFGHKKEKEKKQEGLLESEKIEQVAEEEQFEEVFPMDMSPQTDDLLDAKSVDDFVKDIPFYDGDNDNEFNIIEDEPDLSANLDKEDITVVEDSDDFEDKLDIQEIVETSTMDTEDVVADKKEEKTASDDSFINSETMPLESSDQLSKKEATFSSTDIAEPATVQPSTASMELMADYYKRKAAFEEDIRQGKYQTQETKDVSNSDALMATESSESNQEKYDRSLAKTRTGFSARLNAFFANFRSVDEEFFEELEELLILSDVGVTVATKLTEELRQEAKLENAKKPEALRRVVIQKLVDIYEKDGIYNEAVNYQAGLTVMLFVGVNGVGKTTSIGKLAYKYKNEGKKVMLVAADTFRAGAVAQLAEWGRRVDVPVVVGPEKADPASVVFDGVERAVAEHVDILLIDTAGRLQNKENLMAELEKMGRIIKRVIPDAPHETLLALDASTGQNALSQAKEFSKIMSLTGLILTKIDGSAKGGVVLAIRQELDIPVKFIGFGEKIDDIGQFDSEEFMKGLLGDII
ncbi:signal recognition particle-docking protein FtsY [Streptococcus hongkongensis]|nr:cell division protein FtsY [Streptococcus uberis]